MKQLTRICIIGGGVLETDGKNYFVKAAVNEYLNELKSYFKEVTFIAAVEEGRKYISRLDPGIIKIVPLGKTKQSVGISDILKDMWASFRIFNSLFDKNTGVIISGVYVGVVGRIAIAKIFAGRVIYYIGSDPKLTEQLKAKTLNGYLKRIALKIAFPLAAKLSDGLLVRGQLVYKQAIRWNNNITVSNPLITYSRYKNINPQYKSDTKEIFNILYVGKLVENKGVHILIEAVAKLLRQDKYCCSLTIVGSGEEMNRLNEMTVRLGIVKTVQYTGYIDDMNKLLGFYFQSDVLAVPSVKTEGFPRVIEEAMVCGLPVICSRLGGMKEGFDEDDVVFVAPGNADELYAALKKVSSDRIYRNNLKKKSLDRSVAIMSMTAAEQHAKFILKSD